MMIWVGEDYSSNRNILAGVPQGSVLGPLLYLLFTSDIPLAKKRSILGKFADDTTYLSSHRNQFIAVRSLEENLKEVETWKDRKDINMNCEKTIFIIFTNKKIRKITLKFCNTPIPLSNVAKYLGITLDTKLKWKHHIKLKKKECNFKVYRLNWLLGKKSSLSLDNKLLLYKQIIRPTWAYGCQIWGCAPKTSLKSLQSMQSKILRKLCGAQRYETNKDIHRDLGIESIYKYIQKISQRYEDRLHRHPNETAIELLNNIKEIRRLKRKKPWELVTNADSDF